MHTGAKAALPGIYEKIRDGSLNQVEKDLETLLVRELDNPELKHIIKCVSFWMRPLQKTDSCLSPYEKGEMLLMTWQSFVDYLSEEKLEYDECVQSLKYFAFRQAYTYYSQASHEKQFEIDPEVYRKIGLCVKSLGDYEQALSFFDRAYSLNQSSAPLLAELADCQALCGENRLSKVLFREAFFIDPQKIELQVLESEMIRILITNTEKAGYRGKELLEWIPVYGVLSGIFNVRRELHAIELGKLKQSCFALENRIKDAEDEQKNLLIPRLINHYFWLIDHYILSKDDTGKKNEVLLKIKMLDPNIYAKYNA